MPYAEHDGVKLFYDQTGSGTTVVFLHEFAGDHRSWTLQTGHFSSRYRCLAFAARGYPPSDVPDSPDAYGQDIANGDVIAVLDHLGIGKAHFVGLSMGAYTALQMALHHPDRCRSVVAASGGSGAFPPTRDAFLAECGAVADQIEQAGRFPAEQMGQGPTRIQLFNKHPDRWRTFVDHAAEHPAKAAAMILRQIQAERPSLYDLEDSLRAVTLPVLLLVGDEDESCLDVNLHLKRVMPAASLVVFPGCGHLLNLEEPGLFDRFAGEFFRAVDAGTWRPRDPSTLAAAGKAATALGLVEEG